MYPAGGADAMVSGRRGSEGIARGRGRPYNQFPLTVTFFSEVISCGQNPSEGVERACPGPVGPYPVRVFS